MDIAFIASSGYVVTVLAHVVMSAVRVPAIVMATGHAVSTGKIAVVTAPNGAVAIARIAMGVAHTMLLLLLLLLKKQPRLSLVSLLPRLFVVWKTYR